MTPALYGAAGALVAGLLLGTGGAASWYSPRLELAGHELKEAREQRDSAVRANKQCASDVGKATDAVSALKAEATERASKAAAALAKAEGRAADLARRPPAWPPRPVRLAG